MKLLPPKKRPIAQEQLVIEVKGIYAELVMIEAISIDINKRQSDTTHGRDPSKRLEVKNDVWQSLIILHKQLLHGHYDFFLASQYLSAFEDTWIECPGTLGNAWIECLGNFPEKMSSWKKPFIDMLLTEDLGRYRMIIDEDEPGDRDVWSNIARFWHQKASDKAPKIGRLYHHLAIIPHLYTLEQLSLYPRSLTYTDLFEGAESSIMTHSHTVFKHSNASARSPLSIEVLFIEVNTLLFCGQIPSSLARSNAVMDPQGDSFFYLNDATTGRKRRSSVEFCFVRSSWRQNSANIGGCQRMSCIRRTMINLGLSPTLAILKKIPMVPKQKRTKMVLSPFNLFFTLFISTVNGTPPKRDVTDITVNTALPQSPSFFNGWPHLFFAAVVLLMARFLAHRKGPIPVWGCMMAVWAFAWLGIREDTATSLWLMGT